MNLKRFVSAFLSMGVMIWSFSLFAASENSDTDIDKNTGLRAQLRPKSFTTLSSELAARIKKLDFHEGDSFKNGDILVELDCKVERARLLKARARLEVARKGVEVNKRLNDLESISIMEMEKSNAEMKEAEANITVMEAVIDECIIYAPFSGRISTLHAQKHQFVSIGQPLLEILDDTSLEVELLIPSRWLMWIKPGLEFHVKIDETGKEYSAKIVRIGASIDPISQSVKITGTIDDKEGNLLSGMSGHAFFRQE
ncbi:MAG: efflux RND transporter periplasmic adaptor subunit [Desulfobacteraceae bacterium]|jgi:RND family efflux transporter MFP subunit